MLIVDCSIAVKWIVEEQGSAEAEKLLPGFGPQKAEFGNLLAAPALILLETSYVLAKLYNKREVSEELLRNAMRKLQNALILDPVDTDMAMKASAVSLSALSDHPPGPPFSIYDSAYIAMAIALRARLATADARQAAAAKAQGVGVFFIGQDADRSG
jgi:predicted nucleic acid-binding protein